MSLSPPAFERRGSLLRRKKASGLPSSRHSLKTERESSLMDKVEPNSSLDTMSNVRTFNGERPATAFRPLLSDTSSRAASSANLRANGSHYLATPMTSYGPTSMPILPGSYLPYLPPSVDEEHIYESLHNARWESMKKEEARLQRESTRWNSPSPPGSLASSREGSVGPGGASNVWGHPEPSAEIMVGTSKPPRSLYLHKTNQDNFGFTLRHCIVYAPEVPDNPNVQPETKETIFVKSVKPEGPAYRAGMRVGDRIMSVNGEQVAGKTYSHVVQSIKNVPDVLFLTVLPQEEDVIQKYFYDIAQNPETNQPIKGSPALSHKSFLSSRGPMSDFMPTDSSEHLYAEPAQIREYRNPSPMSHYHDPDRLALNRIKREFEMKEKFMNRPPEDFNTTLVTSEELRESPRPKKSSRSRKQKSDSPSRVPRPSETFVDGMMCSKGDGGSSLSSPKSHSQSSQNEIENYAPSNALIMDRIREEGADSETVTTAPHHRYGSHDHTSSRRSSAASETPPPLPSSSSSTTTITTTTSASQDLSRYPFETRQFLHHHHPSSAMSQIRRRPKPILTQEETDEKNLRRASYLRATKNEEYVRNVPLDPCVITTSADTDYEMVTSTSKPLLSSSSTTTTKKLQSSGAEKYPVSSNSIQRIKTRFGEKTDSSQEDLESHGPLQAEEIKQGWLQIKVMALEGKKANDRSWKNVYVVIRSNRMFMYKDKKVATENPQSTEEIPVPLAESYVDVADDYTKRKNVFRIKTNLGSEYLCQADQEQDMKEWITAIEDSNVYFVVDERKDSGPGSVLLPVGSGSSVRGLKKFTSFRHRSPSLHSPAAKSRKPSQDPMPSRDTPAQTSHQVPSNSTANSMTSSVPNLDSAGPMGGACPTEETKRDKKTLMGKMAKQWKKIQHGSPATPQTVVPESGSLGVPLESCPMSEDPNHERVPKLVTTCCKIVEERGLEIVGVYRVPGNTAAVNCLTEQLKHADPEEAFKMDDYRWNDVNVVSSLLKSFFRKLPEPLFTAELYPRFIKASMIEDSGQRLHTLKRLIQALPPINLDTLEYVMRHLTKVIEFCNVNKMEVKNLAIVFGPTLVRPDGDDMMLMVTDMAQQCRIIESILAHAEWFFNNEPVDEHAVSSFVLDLAEPQTVIARTAQESVLLTNLQKLEYQGKVQSPSRDMSAKEVVSSIISAAQRKKNRPSAPSHKVSPNPIMINSQRMEPERLQTPPMSENSSRRNSESMMQVTPTDSSPSPNLGVASNNERRRTSSRSGEASYLNLPSSSYMKKISASAENINRVCNLSVQQLQSSPSRKFPLTESTTTYQNESNRESPGKSHFRSEILPGPESPTLDAWKSNSDQILLQDPYPTQAYNSDPADAKSRFLNQTYFKRNADPRLPINRVHSASNLMEGLAEFSSSKTPPIASPLKRHQFQKSATESLLIVDEKKTATKKLNDDGNKTRTVRTVTPTRDQEKEEREKHEERLVDDSEHGKLISQLNTFDESLRLLIDPNSQSDPDSHVKAHPQRRMSSITVLNPSSKPPSSSSSSSAISNAKTTRSISVGGRPPPLALKDKRNQVSRKSELKRGKLVDKKKQPSPTLINLKRNDSLNKKEKQNVNIRQKAAEKENNNAAQKLWEEHLLKDPTAASKIIKTLSNQCQIKRRNTVGSPNDIENQSRKSHFSMNNHRRTAPMTIGHRWSSMDSAGSNEDEPTEPEEPRTEEDEDEHIVGKESENKRLREFALAISEVGSQRSSEVRNGSPAKDNSNPPPKMPSLLESQV